MFLVKPKGSIGEKKKILNPTDEQKEKEKEKKKRESPRHI
jgi:hypothetical protein